MHEKFPLAERSIYQTRYLKSLRMKNPYHDIRFTNFQQCSRK